MRKLQITTGTNDAECVTKAATETGYIKAAKRLCGEAISHGMQAIRIKVVEDGEVIFETTRTVCA